MPKVVRERDGLGKILVERKRARDGSRNRCDFDRVREACAIVVAGAVEEDLGLAIESAKGGGVNDSRTIALKIGAIGVFRFPVRAPELLYYELFL